MKNKKITKVEEKLKKTENTFLSPIVPMKINNDNQKPILIIDDIEANLDFKQRRMIINNLKRINLNAQIMISTSCPYVATDILDDEDIKIHSLDKDNNILNEAKRISDKPLIITEGKTDWKHLKKALERFKARGEYTNLNIEFKEYEDEISMSDSELVSMVVSYSKTLQSKKHIMIFDRDATQKRDIKKIFEKDNAYNFHGNSVYSIFIPEIDNRLNEICIEFYYKQEEVKNAWYKGKRLFYGNEFDKETQISICGKYKTDKPYPKPLDILDGDNKKKVYLIDDEEKKENNIALSKNKFAEYVDIKDEFKNFDIENFKLIFDVIEKIIND